MTALHDDVTTWVAICPLSRVPRERGVAALLGDRQVAVFRTFDDELYAIDHRDPFTGVHVLARGIVGSRGDVPTVASPLHKQVFDLRTGVCLDEPSVAVDTYQVRVADGVVEVAATGGAP